MKKIFSVYLLIIMCFCSCQEEDNLSYPHPICHVGEVSDISESGAIFNASISSLGDEDIIDHGFLWSIKNVDINTSRISLGSKDDDGHFESKIDFDLMEDTTYLVSSYLKTNSTWIISNAKKFISKGSLAPVLTGVMPENADANDTITLIGERFSYVPNHLQVLFDDTKLEVLSSTPYEIKAVLPKYIYTSGHFSLKVKSQNGNSSEEINLRINGPFITSVFPKSGFPGTLVEIIGQNFGSSSNYANLVQLGRVNCQIIEWTDQLVKVKLPNSSEGISDISLRNVYKTTSYKNAYETIYPKILDYSPKSVFPGDTIYVELENPDPNIAMYRAKFDDYNIADPIKIEGNVLSFLTPSRTSPGLKTFSLQYNYKKHEFSEQINIESSFIPLAELPSDQLQNPFLFELEGNIYIGGGNIQDSYTSTLTKEIWMYRTSNDTWERKADFPGTARIMSGYFSFNNKGYIVGGRENSYYNHESSSEVWEYNPENDTWIQKNDYPEGGVEEPQCQVIGEKVYVGYGRRNGQALKRFHEYDPNSDSWKELNVTDVSSYQYSSLIYKDKFYLFSIYTDQIQVYSPTENSWTSLKIGEIGTFNTINASLVIEDDIYILGDIGYNWKLVKISPETENWSELFINTYHPFSSEDISVNMNNQIFYFNSNNPYNDPMYHLYRLDLPLK